MEKKIFEEAKMEVVELSNDVIRTSAVEVNLNDMGDPWADPWNK